MTKDRLIRHLVPSMPVVARWPGVRRTLDAADGILRRVDARYARLPPASLRIRIGVGNQILRNAAVFDAGQAFVRRCMERGWVGEGAHVVELGSGIGRNAMAFRDQLQFATYDGVDVDAEMVDWCCRHLSNDRMRFHHADLYSAVYNPGGTPIQGYRLPVADQSATFSLGISVFSHLVAAHADYYAGELARVTSPGSFACHTFFLLDHIQRLLGDRWTFSHEADGCWLESQKYPEAAVAYWMGDVKEMFESKGLTVVEVLDRDQHQQLVVFRRES